MSLAASVLVMLVGLWIKATRLAVVLTNSSDRKVRRHPTASPFSSLLPCSFSLCSFFTGGAWNTISNSSPSLKSCLNFSRSGTLRKAQYSWFSWPPILDFPSFQPPPGSCYHTMSSSRNSIVCDSGKAWMSSPTTHLTSRNSAVV